ncbi:MAG: histidine phosphatase family protein [Chloroflexi bacterium]|nr:histidine phosphatase family protein [Chloroflexota bacterium]MCC6894175.1 histidine phosphatase family protein [Anaerolineae bacterium]
MVRLVLVRHAASQPQPGTSAHNWQLANAGHDQCRLLADRLRPYNIRHIITSDEPKAVQTGTLLASYLGDLPLSQAADLRETHRKTAPFFADETAFREAIATAMHQPQKLLYGEETFEAARLRFSAAVDRLTSAHPDETIALVSHGTILSLFLAHRMNVPPYSIWSLLDMPAYAILTLPDLQVRELCFSLRHL